MRSRRKSKKRRVGSGKVTMQGKNVPYAKQQTAAGSIIRTRVTLLMIIEDKMKGVLKSISRDYAEK